MVAVAEQKQSRSGFGPKLRSLREAAGLTQTELGERADLLYQTIAKYERGEREPTWGTLLKLADALNLDLNAFRETASVGQPAIGPEPTAPPPVSKRK